MDGDTLYIPASSTEEVIAVPIGPQYAADPEDVINALRGEEAPLDLWLDFVKAYLAAGHTRHAETMLREGTSAEVENHFNALEDETARSVPQRVQLLCALAAFNTAQGRAHRDRGARNEAFAKAAGLISQARALDHREQLPSLISAQLALAKGDADGAKREYERAMNLQCNGQPNIAPLLGLATFNFHQGRYAPAFAMFKRALKEHPGCPAEVRLGLAACAFKLGKLDAARAAFRRALQLQPGCVPALVGLAVLALHGPPSPDRYANALQLLCQAYDVAPAHPVVLNMLAHHCLLRGEYDKVTTLVTAALAAADSDALRADAETLLARAAHAQRDMTAAFTHYRQALVADNKRPLPNYGLAQISILGKELTNAISLLESALTQQPGWADALMVLGGVYPHVQGKRDAAVAQFKEATTQPNASAEVWHIFGELLTASDPTGALKAYEKALEQYQRQAKAQPVTDGASAAQQAAGPPLKLLNNAAVLHMRTGNLAAALPLMEQAVQAATDGATAARLTVGFNMARMREASGELQTARKEYAAMLDSFPDYMDCLMRLAAIAARRGNKQEAVEQLRAILSRRADHSDALAFLGQLYFESKEYAEAHETFEKLAALPDHKHDAFGRLGLANMLFYSTPSDSHKEELKAKRRIKLTQSLRAYKDILKRHPGNLYAANGVGAVLAEQGRLAEAREIFNELQEAVAAEGLLRVPDVWANAGGAALGLQDAAAAVQQFGTALRRFHGGRNDRLMLWLARAYYDAENLEAARKWLLKALHVAPTQHLLRFNIAATMQQAAVRTLRKERAAGDTSKLEEYERAAGELNAAYATFVHLKRLPPARSGIELNKLDAHIQFCESTFAKAQSYVENAKQERARVEARRKEQELRLQAAAAAKVAEEKRRAAEAEAAKREKQARAAAALEKLERLKAGWKESQAVQAAAAAGDSGAVAKKKAQDKADAQVDQLFESDDDDQEYDPSAPDPQFDAEAGRADSDDAQGAFAEAGLLSDDEESAQEEDSETEAAAADKPKKKKKKKNKGKDKGGKEGGKGRARKGKEAASPAGRLKRRRDAAAAEEEATAASGLEDALEDGAVADEEDTGPSSKRSRVALFEDSDEEAGDDAAAPDGAAGAAQNADEGPRKDELQGMEGLERQPGSAAEDDALGDLFGSDDE